MARKRTPKAKEPIRLRFKKLANGNQSIYLDIYRNGVRSYEFLNLCIIPENTPFAKMQNKEMPVRSDVQMDYLTIDEVKILMQTPLKQTQIKQAFLFACFTGLRISDVRNLQWSNIKTDGDIMRFEIIMKKTDTPLAGKIPNIAKEWMPEPTDSPFVFANLPTASNIDTVIRRWVAQSGIKKHVTFHTARHTFATMGLTIGTDLYTVSKLLGHKSIATTQVYAQIIDKKKGEASDLLDNAF